MSTSIEGFDFSFFLAFFRDVFRGDLSALAKVVGLEIDELEALAAQCKAEPDERLTVSVHTSDAVRRMTNLSFFLISVVNIESRKNEPLADTFDLLAKRMPGSVEKIMSGNLRDLGAGIDELTMNYVDTRNTATVT